MMSYNLPVPVYLYVISAPTGHVKIGITYDVIQRWRTLRAPFGGTKTIERVWHRPNDCRAIESYVKRQMSARKFRGEWFKAAVEDVTACVEAAVSVATIRRKFKASGRAGGWPVKD